MSEPATDAEPVDLVGFGLAVLMSTALWAIALASYLSGNESAVNALVGIPLGLLSAAPMLWLVLSAANEWAS